MQELYRSRYSFILFDEKNSLIEFCYTPETANMSEEAYKTDIMAYFKCLRDYKPMRMLSDMQHFYFSIEPAVQDWINQTLTPTLPQNLQAKSALITSPDIFAKVSVEQTVEDSLKQTRSTEQSVVNGLRYFANRAEAIAWLME